MQWLIRWKQQQRAKQSWLYRFYQRQQTKNTGLYRVLANLNYRWCGSPCRPARIALQVDLATAILAKFKKYGGGGVLPVEQATYYEVGCGWDLVNLLLMSGWGMSRLVGVDVSRMAYPQNLVKVWRYLTTRQPELGLALPPVNANLTTENLAQVLQQSLRIAYQAPCDSEHTGLTSNSVDYMVAQWVFEHIDREHLPGVLRECHRLLKPGGVFYLSIDYADHSIYQRPRRDYVRNAYTYLQYSATAWQQKYAWRSDGNSAQNRLRTRDYVALLQAAGFKILEQQPIPGRQGRVYQWRPIKVAECFQQYSLAELKELGCDFVLTKTTDE